MTKPKLSPISQKGVEKEAIVPNRAQLPEYSWGFLCFGGRFSKRKRFTEVDM
jgi:hypothetical protein